MSAMGDTNLFRSENIDEIGEVGRIGNVSIPFCVFHALDDPLTTWRVNSRQPGKLVETGDGYIMMLLTKEGGHVGWPLGKNPRNEGWRFMNDAVAGFVTSVDKARRELFKTN